MMKNLILILAATTLLTFCQTNKSSESNTLAEPTIAELKTEVLAIHDEVMPKMGELRRARKDLMLQADSLTESNPERAAILNAAADELGSANDGMMQWMRAYEPEFEGTEEEIREYLEAQKTSIQEVKENMLGSLEKGREILANE